jgi:hypothetical protein
LSSILRALRKLDHEVLSGEPESGAEKVKMRRVLQRRTVSPRQVNRVLSVALAVTLVAVAWFLIRWQVKSLPEKKQEFAQQKPVSMPVSQKASQQPALPKPEIKRASAVETTLAVSGEETAKPLADPAPPGPAPAQSSPSPGLSPGIQRGTSPSLASQPAHPQLNFSGVLWSDKPGRRVALINDRYLKEGDEINGVTVIKIEKKSVTLQSGTEKWTLNIKK